MAEKIILHIDFDSFFASVEQQNNPHLRNRPVGVTATNGRTAIIAASKEAKKLGIKNVIRSYEAYQICPWLILTPGHFYHYFEVSKKFLKLCDKFSPQVELFSIDEVFMDITQTVKLFGSVSSLIKMLKYQINQEIGEYITVSIGISYNKLLAKLASRINKPNGICEITKENVWDMYQRAKLTDICGIGDRIALKLNKIGIYKLLQLRDIPLEILIREFGNVEGRFLKHIGLGIDTDEIVPYSKAPAVKSVSRNYCLPQNEFNKRIIYQNVFELCEEIALKLRRLNKKAHTVALGIKGTGHYFKRKTVSEYMNTGIELFTLCKQFLDEWEIPMARMISVHAANLADTKYVPLPLFDESKRKDTLQIAIDAINKKFGDHTIRNGFLLYSQELTTVPNGYMADTYERMKLAQSY